MSLVYMFLRSALVKIRRAWRTPVFRLLDEPVTWEVPIKRIRRFAITWSKSIQYFADYGPLPADDRRSKRNAANGQLRSANCMWKFHVNRGKIKGVMPSRVEVPPLSGLIQFFSSRLRVKMWKIFPCVLNRETEEKVVSSWRKKVCKRSVIPKNHRNRTESNFCIERFTASKHTTSLQRRCNVTTL